MKLQIPEPALVVLVGVSGSGKSTFARMHFRPTEVLSSDACRGLVADDESDQTATVDAFAVLHFIVAKRLARGRLTVVDATNVEPKARQPLLALAREYGCPPVAIVLALPEHVARARNRGRRDRAVGPPIIRRQSEALHHSLPVLRGEGFNPVYVLRSRAAVAAATLARQRADNQGTDAGDPVNSSGEVHGSGDALEALPGDSEGAAACC